MAIVMPKICGADYLSYMKIHLYYKLHKTGLQEMYFASK